MEKSGGAMAEVDPLLTLLIIYKELFTLFLIIAIPISCIVYCIIIVVTVIEKFFNN